MRTMTRLIMLSVAVMAVVALVSPFVAPAGQRCSSCHTGSNPSGGYLFRMPALKAVYPSMVPPGTTFDYKLTVDHVGNYVVLQPRAAITVEGEGNLTPGAEPSLSLQSIQTGGGSISASWSITTANTSGMLYLNTTLRFTAHLRHTNTQENDESPYMLVQYLAISVRPVALYSTVTDVYITSHAGDDTRFDIISFSDARNITLVPTSNIGDIVSIVPAFIPALDRGQRQSVQISVVNGSRVVDNGRIDITWENRTGVKDATFVMVRTSTPAPAPPSGSEVRMTGRITGILSLGLLISSLVLGLVKRGGQSRVRVHCAVSWFILGLSAYHGIMLVLGPYSRTWLGNWVLLGYISAAIMGVSSVNGLARDWMVKKVGYRAWIWIHRITIIVAIILVVIHAILMGTDFKFIRDTFQPDNVGSGGPSGHEVEGPGEEVIGLFRSGGGL